MAKKKIDVVTDTKNETETNKKTTNEVTDAKKETEAKSETKAKKGTKSKKKEITSCNLIGRKCSKMTMKSNVKTLALKVYDEQIPDGWEKLIERITGMSKSRYQILAIKHDRDYLGDDFFEPSIEKAHYHILIRVMDDEGVATKSGSRVSTIIKDLGVVFRPEDATMIENHGIETVGDFGAYATYLTHDTEKAIADGKEHYNLDEIVSNLTPDEILMIRDGYVRVAQQAHKVSTKELIEIDAYLYELGHNLEDFEEWKKKQGFTLRRHSSMKTLRETYERGVDARVQEDNYINKVCIFIKGEPDNGKTFTCRKTLKDLGYTRIHSVDNNGTGKFDDLSPTTQAILVDDQTVPSLLTISDCKMGRIYRRGSGDRFFTGDMFVVTSNVDFDTWVRRCGIFDEVEMQAARSRFFICEMVKDEEGNKILKCINEGNRGGKEEIKEREKRYLEFRDAFEENIKGYIKQNKTDNLRLLNDRSHKLINNTNNGEVAFYLSLAKSPYNKHIETKIEEVTVPNEFIVTGLKTFLTETELSQKPKTKNGELVNLIMKHCTDVKATEEVAKSGEDYVWLKLNMTDELANILLEKLGEWAKVEVTYK